MKWSCGRESEEETVKRNGDQINKIGSLCLAGNIPRDPRKKKSCVQSQMQTLQSTVTYIYHLRSSYSYSGKQISDKTIKYLGFRGEDTSSYNFHVSIYIYISYCNQSPNRLRTTLIFKSNRLGDE